MDLDRQKKVEGNHSMSTEAVVYTRFSPRRNADTSESCKTQISLCEQYAYDNDLDIIQIFEDKAVSGSDENRPLLWDAIAALKKGGVLLVYKYDRLARDLYLSEWIRRSVEKMGAKIVAVSGDIEGDGPEQIMIRQIMAVWAEYERKMIGIRTKHAVLQHQRNGRRMSDTCPYGTMPDPNDAKRIVEYPPEMPAVDMIAKLHGRDLTTHEIVVWMNREMKGMARSKKGWDQRTIKRIIARVG